MANRTILRTLWRHRPILLANAFGLAFLAAVISLLLPKWYAGYASILPPEDQNPQFGMLSAALAQAPALASFAKTGAPSEILIRILESRTVRERVVEENDLERVYKRTNREDAVRVLASRTGLGATTEGVVQIYVLDRDPNRAAAMANSYVSALEEFNQEKRVTTARRTREFIETRLAGTKADLTKNEEQLRSMEETYSSVEIEEQTAAAIGTASDLLAETVDREVRLAVLLPEMRENHPMVVQLRKELGELRGQLNRLIRSQAERDSLSLYVPLEHVPSVKMEMLRLSRELELLNRLYALLTEQYEQSRIQELRDTPIVQVLDHAVPPVRKAKPRRSFITLLGFGLGLLFGAVIAVGAEAGGNSSPPSIRGDLGAFGRFVRRDLLDEPAKKTE